MNVREVLRDSGLQDYIHLLKSRTADPGDTTRRATADWGPTNAFPGKLLQGWLSFHDPGCSRDAVPTDELSAKLPIEVIECIFASLGRAELYNLTQVNRPLSGMALARLYHDLDLDANHNFAGVLRCLETLSSRPHLSDQVYTFVLNWRPEEGRDVAPIEQLLFQVLNSIYPNAYAVCIRGGSISLDRLIYSQNCPKLQCLRLESSYSPIGSNIGSEFVANALVHLEAHIGFVTLVLHHLPRLLSLVVITTDKTRHPHETQKLYHLQHSTLRKLSVVMTWLLYVDPLWIRYLVDNTTPLEKMPNVDHFTFVLSVPPWGALSDLLLGFFLPKLPSVKAIIIDSSLMRPLDLRKITRICPHLINVVLQNENKEWIKEQSRIRWRLFDRGALANALYGSQSMTTLDELRMAFTVCVEHIIDIDSHVDSTSTGI